MHGERIGRIDFPLTSHETAASRGRPSGACENPKPRVCFCVPSRIVLVSSHSSCLLWCSCVLKCRISDGFCNIENDCAPKESAGSTPGPGRRAGRLRAAPGAALSSAPLPATPGGFSPHAPIEGVTSARGRATRRPSSVPAITSPVDRRSPMLQKGSACRHSLSSPPES